MDARDVYNLYEAYRSVYAEQEALNEDVDYDLEEANRYEQRLGGRGIEPVLIRSDRNRKFDGEDLDLKGEAESIKKHPRYVAGHRRGGNPKLELRFHPRIEAHKERRGVKKQRGMKEELDLYDVVLDHLLDEGYCDDVESAEVIMANMSEEWLDGILDEAKVDAGKSDDQKVVARRIRQGSNSSWDRDDSNRQANHRFRRNVTKGSSDYADPHGTYDRRPNTYKKEQEYVKKLSPEDREKRMEQNRRSIRRGR